MCINQKRKQNLRGLKKKGNWCIASSATNVKCMDKKLELDIEFFNEVFSCFTVCLRNLLEDRFACSDRIFFFERDGNFDIFVNKVFVTSSLMLRNETILKSYLDGKFMREWHEKNDQKQNE